MLTELELKRITAAALNQSRADETEVAVFDSDSSLTRFANNEIHQNVSQRDTTLLVKVVFGKKIGVASLNRADEAGARLVIERANDLAHFQVDNPDFQSLPLPVPIAAVAGPSQGTIDFTPEDRAWAVSVILDKALQHGLVAAGAFSTGVSQVAVANSHGVFCHHTNTEAQVSAVMMSSGSSGSSGYAARLTPNAAEVDPEDIAEEVAQKTLRGQNPRSLEPGEYEVVLEGYAVSDLMDFLAYLGFGALAMQEGRSFLSGRMGQSVLGKNITIWDDGLADDTITLPFDYEGVPRQRVDLITEGVARGTAYDTTTAAKDSKESTGHALPAGATFGPVPLHLHLAPGTASRDELIRSVKRGILITRFWYTRMVHPLSVTVTGMTRDGTFLIENGEVVAPVRNLRFTQSYVEALNAVDLIGREVSLQKEFFGHNRVPALKIGKWNFTGTTEY